MGNLIKGQTGGIRRKDIRAQVVTEKIEREPGINISYPQLKGLPNKEIEANINQDIRQLVEQMMNQQGTGDPELSSMVAEYKVTLNQYGLISIKLDNNNYYKGAAHGLTIQRAINVDMITGEKLALNNIFKPNTPYLKRISDIIKQIIVRKDIPLINEFDRINDDQEFFLTPKGIVIYFQVYDYTPYVVGIPEFNIPYTYVANFIREDSPVRKLLNRRRIIG